MNPYKSLRRIAAKLANEYHDFFREKMDEWDIDSPVELDDEGQAEFFTEVKEEWGSRSAYQKLLTQRDLQRLPPLYAQDGKGMGATAYVKFFTPWTDWTWFATEHDPESGDFFGYVISPHGKELRYFNLRQLQSLRGPGGLRVERDISFRPQPLSQAIAEFQRERGR